MSSINTKQNIEATTKGYVSSFADAKAENNPQLVNRNTSPECLRSMLPSILGGGGTMNNEAYEVIFTKGLQAGGIESANITDLVIDVDARKAAVTAVADMVFLGEKSSMDFSWFLHFNEEGTKIVKIVEFVDSLTFTGLQQKMAGAEDRMWNLQEYVMHRSRSHSPLTDNSTSTGRKCDGYQISPAPSTPPTCLIPTYTSHAEAKSLQFFIEKTLVNFQTFFPDNLWSTKILQVAHDQGCIKNGLMALSHFHRLYLTHQQWQKVDSVPALKHYNFAIRELLSPSPDVQGHVLVLSCLIFICIELLQGNTESAISLFKYGCSMIQQHRKNSPRFKAKDGPRSDIEETLNLAEACFKRIAVQFLTLMSDNDSTLWFLFYNTFGSSLTLRENSFTCLADAREALLDILVDQASPGLKGKSARDIMAHSAKVTRWGELFDALLLRQTNSGSPPTDSGSRTIALLQVHRKYSEINVAKYIHGQGDPCFWDKFTTEFNEIVDHAATAAGIDQNHAKRNWDTESSPKAYFHIDIGFTSVLISVIARCRDPFVRRRAIAVMLTDRVQEGAFNGSQSARVAARVMELEETRSGKEVKCSSDIPHEARVRQIRVHLQGGEDKKMRLVYKFSQDCFEEERSMTE
ncbi:unnamed protein product [Fusarium graminearum]|uniref:Uncharacterized protein n=1 Tax=Gibberella zeae TaxID=5518 RepID=A0A4E9EPZ9_GIBZA|nr:unnamed protein product [Fusarium graminearum]CAF3494042.1 unnamed protein product [Fusarium graminearum]CAG1979205.1 unnamed protein product [Fusarium graminearum]CAG1990391.1 unnamed protein product [Fusarium graminearum]